MAYTINTVDVWSGTVTDRPGGLAAKMAALSEAGANLEFVIARRDLPGTGVLFFAPIKGTKQMRAAKKAGLAKSESLRSLRVEGPDKAGVGALITEAIAEEGINMRGLSAAALGQRAVFYFAFDNRADATKARSVLKKVLGVKRRGTTKK